MFGSRASSSSERAPPQDAKTPRGFAAPAPTERSISPFTNSIFNFMKLGHAERVAAANNPQLAAEVTFHVAALLACSCSFAFALTKFSQGVLHYPWYEALLFGLLAASMLYAVDKNLLIQARGTRDRSNFWKVRIGSLLIVMLSYALMAVGSFGDTVHAELLAKADRLRPTYAARPEFALPLASARQELEIQNANARRIEELHSQRATYTAQLASENEGWTNECEGNIVGNRVYVPRCGPRARGHRAAAQRYQNLINAVDQEISQAGDVAAKQAAARREIERIDAAINLALQAETTGVKNEFTALFGLVFTNPYVALAVIFWVAVGWIPDAAMWLAQDKSANNEGWLKAREAQAKITDLHLARAHADVRNRQTNSLEPLHVKIPVPRKPRGEPK